MPSLFTSQTPTTPNDDNGGPVVVATGMYFTVSGFVTHIRFFAATTVSGTYTGGLYQQTADDDPAGTGTGTLLGSATFGAITGGAWNTVAIGPVAVSANTTYRSAVCITNGRFARTGAFWGSSLTNGNIIGIQNNSNPVGLGETDNPTYEDSGTLVYPNNFFDTSNYFVDVVFETSLPGTSRPLPRRSRIPALINL